MKVFNASLKHKDPVHTLIYLDKGFKIDEQSMHVDSTNLFSRLVVILEWSDILSHCFKYKCTLFSTLQFKDSAI